MKKRIVISTLLLIIPILASWFSGKTVDAADTSVQIVIHKKKMTDLPDPLIQNTGKEMSEFDNYQGLGDVTFSVYDVTTEFYTHRNNVESVDAAKQAVQSLTPGNPIATGVTDASGNLTLSLPKNQNGKDAVYVIAEQPKAGVVRSTNLVVAFPVYEMIKQADSSYKYSTEELNTVHIYPKNKVTSDGMLVVKKIGTADNEALNGAEFIISKTEGTIVKYIQGVKDGLYTWTTDKNTAKHFVTGNAYDIGSTDFSEVATDKGKLTINSLEVGSYVLEEVKAPNNAALIDNQTKTPVEIIEKSHTPVEKTIKNDTSHVKKTTPQLNGKDVAIGEDIQYEISVNIPQGIADKEGTANKYTKLNLVDTHDAALAFSNTPTGKTGYVLYDGNRIIDQSHYTVTEQGNGFTLAVDPAYIPSLTPGATLKFTYFMHLNEQADPTKGFTNEANVENGHTEDQTPPQVNVVTGGKRFIKIDGDVSVDEPLTDAVFVVREQDSDTANYLVINPKTKAISWTASKDQATVFITKKDGLIDVTGLKYGTYYLEEIKAPENYVPLTNRISFDVNNSSYQTTGSLVSPEKVPNKHKGTLPSTGGKGIYLYIGIGAVLLIIVGIYFTRRKSY